MPRVYMSVPIKHPPSTFAALVTVAASVDGLRILVAADESILDKLDAAVEQLLTAAWYIKSENRQAADDVLLQTIGDKNLFTGRYSSATSVKSLWKIIR